MDEDTRYEKCQEEVHVVISKWYPSGTPLSEYHSALRALQSEFGTMIAADKVED